MNILYTLPPKALDDTSNGVKNEDDAKKLKELCDSITEEGVEEILYEDEDISTFESSEKLHQWLANNIAQIARNTLRLKKQVEKMNTQMFNSQDEKISALESKTNEFETKLAQQSYNNNNLQDSKIKSLELKINQLETKLAQQSYYDNNLQDSKIKSLELKINQLETKLVQQSHHTNVLQQSYNNTNNNNSQNSKIKSLESEIHSLNYTVRNLKYEIECFKDEIECFKDNSTHEYRSSIQRDNQISKIAFFSLFFTCILALYVYFIPNQNLEDSED